MSNTKYVSRAVLTLGLLLKRCWAVVTALCLFASTAWAGAIFLTGHDPDFHAFAGANIGAQHILQRGISFILNPATNPFAAAGVTKFLYVESAIPPPAGHIDGMNGLAAAGFVAGTDFERHTAATLNAELDLLGTKYGAIVVASDFGALLTQAELDKLNARASDIASFLSLGGGLLALAESNTGAGLTPGGGHFGFLPFPVSSAPTAYCGPVSVTPFGASLGLTNADVSFQCSDHNFFTATSGLSIVDTTDTTPPNIVSLASVHIVVALDVKPGSCPNPLSTRQQGQLPVAILGSASFDVTQIDPASVRLEGVAPLRSTIDDVATPFLPLLGKSDCSRDCTAAGADGFPDLVLHFDSLAVLAALNPPPSGGQCRLLRVTGNLKPEFGGTAILGEDVVTIVP